MFLWKGLKVGCSVMFLKPFGFAFPVNVSNPFPQSPNSLEEFDSVIGSHPRVSTVFASITDPTYGHTIHPFLIVSQSGAPFFAPWTAATSGYFHPSDAKAYRTAQGSLRPYLNIPTMNLTGLAFWDSGKVVSALN
jgi:hypothetical protein